MAKFTVRIQLENVQKDEYLSIHEAMKNSGFHRTISGKTNIIYRLPRAEYSYQSDVTAKTVLEHIKSVLQSIGFFDYSILVTEVKKRAWYGLAIIDDDTEE